MLKNKNPLSDYAKYSALALQMCVIIAGGAVGGFYADKFFAWKIPICTIIFSLLAVTIAIYLAVKDFLKK